MELEDHMDDKLGTSQVAEAFGVKPVTVSSWVKAGRLRGSMPRKARRLGRTFTIRELFYFAQAADDDGASEEQLRTWWKAHRNELVPVQTGGESRTDALLS